MIPNIKEATVCRTRIIPLTITEADVAADQAKALADKNDIINYEKLVVTRDVIQKPTYSPVGFSRYTDMVPGSINTDTNAAVNNIDQRALFYNNLTIHQLSRYGIDGATNLIKIPSLKLANAAGKESLDSLDTIGTKYLDAMRRFFTDRNKINSTFIIDSPMLKSKQSLVQSAHVNKTLANLMKLYSTEDARKLPTAPPVDTASMPETPLKYHSGVNAVAMEANFVITISSVDITIDVIENGFVTSAEYSIADKLQYLDLQCSLDMGTYFSPCIVGILTRKCNSINIGTLEVPKYKRILTIDGVIKSNGLYNNRLHTSRKVLDKSLFKLSFKNPDKHTYKHTDTYADKLLTGADISVNIYTPTYYTVSAPSDSFFYTMDESKIGDIKNINVIAGAPIMLGACLANE